MFLVCHVVKAVSMKMIGLLFVVKAVHLPCS